jgi:hypothetical protein
MRRISLALALLGAVAAAGCGGAGSKSPSSSGGNKGVEDTTWKLVVRGEGAFLDPATNTTIILPKGGVITSDVGGINCGAVGTTLNKVCEVMLPYGTAVTLTATPNIAGWAHGWAGACTGTGGCSFTMNDTQFVGVRFAADTAGLGAHPGFTDPAIHGQEFFKVVDIDGNFLTTATGLPATGFLCTACHGGAALTGAGIAPSCASCHNWPISKGGHFDAAGAMAGHNGTGCGRCHNSDNFRDFTGADGSSSEAQSAASVAYISGQTQFLDGLSTVAGPAKDPNRTPGQMHCNTCHNSTTDAHFGSWADKKVFVRNVTLTLDGVTALCAQCHDGARPQYNAAQLDWVLGLPSNAAVGADQQLVASNATVRAHYLPAAATMYGKEVGNWSQYSGMNYTGRNPHGGKAQCTFCHDAHDGTLPADGTGALQVGGKCGVCHFEGTARITTMAKLEEVRQYGFEGDIDGNGAAESLQVEIAGLQATLYTAIQTYADKVVGTKICNIIPAAGTTNPDNKLYVWDGSTPCATTMTAYNKYTPRLLKAAYNFLMSQNDFGSWAHNPRYAIEVLFDTITDLNAGLVAKGFGAVPFGAAKRSFGGHFGAADAASPYSAFVYHGAPQGFTSEACYQCHGGQGGFEAYLAVDPAALTSRTVPAVITDANKVTGMQCGTCHTFGDNMKGVRSAESIGTVYFPPQKGSPPPANQNVVAVAATNLPNSVALCGSCHSGRENGASIDIKIGTTTNNVWSLSFVNPHYLGAAGMMLGSTAGVMYQFPGMNYVATPAFWNNPVSNTNGPHGSPHGAACVKCHDPRDSEHSFAVDLSKTVVDGTFYGAANTKACDGCHAGGYSLAPKITEFYDASAELYTAIRNYAVDPVNLASIQTAVDKTKIKDSAGNVIYTVVGSTVTGVCYNGSANPYFFVEISGVCADGTANAPNPAVSFGKFNPTLLKAAYNYQWTQKEPGAWAHNEFYVMEEIFDSITSLGATPTFTVTASTTDTTLNR